MKLEMLFEGDSIYCQWDTEVSINMYEIPAAGGLVSLLSTFEKWGGVIDYVQVGWEPELVLAHDMYERHKAAAVFTAQVVMDRDLRYRRRHWAGHEANMKKVWPWLTEETLYRIDKRKGTHIRPEEAKGYPISLHDFFAPPRLWIGRNELEKLPSWWDVSSFVAELDRYNQDGCTIATGSYPYAFSDTPYGLVVEEGDTARKVTETEHKELFDAINQQLFGDTLSSLIVYRWSTDWIDFFLFDHNADWWGGYLWTVSSPQTSDIVGIAASATDV